jgi:hypothetical protein
MLEFGVLLYLILSEIFSAIFIKYSLNISALILEVNSSFSSMLEAGNTTVEPPYNKNTNEKLV